MKITLHATTKGFTVNSNHFETAYDKFFANAAELRKILYIIPVKIMEAETSFSCIRWIPNGLNGPHNSTSMDILFYLAAAAIHGHNCYFKTEIHNAYMSIYPHRIITSLPFGDA